jgi:dihydrodiol dehydrogenase / D-xylose 1-dehydrogenase (NADP)
MSSMVQSDRKLRYAILGTSFISHVMVEAILKSDCGEVYCVAGRDQTRLLTFAEKYSIKPCTYSEALSDPQVDVVYIGLPTILHAEFTQRYWIVDRFLLCVYLWYAYF